MVSRCEFKQNHRVCCIVMFIVAQEGAYLLSRSSFGDTLPSDPPSVRPGYCLQRGVQPAIAAGWRQWCCVAAARWFLLHQGVGAVSSSVLPRKRWAGAAVSPHFASERGARRARGLCPSACWRCRACWRIGMHARTDGQPSQFSFARAPLHASHISA